MSWITFLLGVILFLPNYAVALDEVLTVEKKFEPLDVIGNINKSNNIKKGQTLFGLLLCVLGGVFYVVIDSERDLIISDVVKIGLGVLLIWMTITAGYLEEQRLAFNLGVPGFKLNVLFGSTARSWRYSLAKSTKDILLISVVFLFVYLAGKLT